MWAHYANNYTGICLCFKSEVFKGNVRPVKYLDEPIQGSIKESLEEQVYQGFFLKNTQWSYEHEYRIVSSNTEDSYWDYSNDLVGIIIGHNTSPIIKEGLVSRYKNRGIKFMKTHVGYVSNQVKLLPVNYEIIYDGAEPEFISNIDEYLLSNSD